MRFWGCPILISLVLISCAGPKPPKLEHQDTTELEMLLLGDRLDVPTVRKIARALAARGKSPGLVRHIEESNDESLEAWLQLISRYFYEDADQQGGLVSVLSSQSGDFFREALTETHAWAASHSALADLWKAVFSHPQFFPSIQSWVPALLAVRASSDVSAVPISEGEAEGLARELLDLLSKDNVQRDIDSSLARMMRPSILKAALQAASRAGESSSSLAFEIARLLAIDNQEVPLHNLSTIASLLARPSDGLFRYLPKALGQSGAFREVLARFLVRRSTEMTAAQIREQFANEPLSRNEWLALANEEDDGFKSAFQKMYSGYHRVLKSLISIPSPAPEDIRFEREAALVVNSLALTEWTRRICKENLPLLGALIGEEGFQAKLFHKKIQGEEFSLEVMVFANGGWKLSDLVENRLSLLGRSAFAEELKAQIQRERFSSFSYSFEGFSGYLFGDRLHSALRSVDSGRPMVIASEAAGAIFKFFESEAVLPRLETPDLLVSLLTWYRDQPSFLAALNTLRYFLRDLGITSLSEEDRKNILALFAGTQWHSWIEQMLPRLGHLKAFFSEDGSSPLLKWIYEFTQGLSNDDLKVVGQVLAQLPEWGFVDPMKMSLWICVMRSPTRLIWFFESVGILLGPLQEHEVGGAASLFLSIVNGAINEVRAKALCFSFFNGDRLFPKHHWDQPHREWAERFVSSGGLVLLHKASQSIARHSLLQILNALREGVNDGTVLQVLRQLESIKSERFIRGLRLLLNWHANGELPGLLDLAIFWAT